MSLYVLFFPRRKKSTKRNAARGIGAGSKNPHKSDSLIKLKGGFFEQPLPHVPQPRLSVGEMLLFIFCISPNFFVGFFLKSKLTNCSHTLVLTR